MIYQGTLVYIRNAPDKNTPGKPQHIAR